MANKKSDKKIKSFIPPMPFVIIPLGWPVKKDDEDDDKKWDADKQWEDFKSNVDTFLDQLRDMQKSSMKATKDQWNTFFSQCMDMQESFADSLPDEAPEFLPYSPKEFVKKDKELREMVNKHAVKQADAFFDSAMQTQAYVKDVTSEGVKNVEAKVDEKKDKKKDAEEPKAEAKKAAPKRKKKAAPKAEPKVEENVEPAEN